ncbi:ankyrin-2-like [Artemia franciscana]|uniref:ankyrin-2-like n=1 Tax=Artemia franciscana TaxID=6661 RepID=UPI0032DBAEAE
MVSKTRVKKKEINFTYLHKAAKKHGSVSICKRLIQAGTPVRIIVDRKDMTALHKAIIYGHYDVVKCLLDNGANSNSLSFSFGFWWTPLQIAAVRGNIGICELLIKAGAEIDAVRKVDGATALWIAVACCRFIDGYNVVKCLLENGANPNVRTSCGGYFTTALHIAAESGNIGICELLIKAGAEIEVACNVYSVKVISIKTGGSRSEVVKGLLENIANPNRRILWVGFLRTPLQIAAVTGNIGICELLVRAGAQINGVDGCDESPLLSVIELRPKMKSRREYYENYFSVVEYLLKNGANANYKSRNGRKPLHQAVSHNLPQVCQLLVSFGAGVSTPLVWAFRLKRYNIIKYLLKKNTKLNKFENVNKDELDENFLNLADKAVQKEDIEMLQFLIRCENSPLDREWICSKIRNTILKDRTHKKLQFLLSLSNTHPTFGETNSGLTAVCRNNIRKNLGRVQTFGKINKLKIPKTVKRYLACDSLLRHICKGTLINKNQPMKARKNAEQLLWHLNCLY